MSNTMSPKKFYIKKTFCDHLTIVVFNHSGSTILSPNSFHKANWQTIFVKISLVVHQRAKTVVMDEW